MLLLSALFALVLATMTALVAADGDWEGGTASRVKFLGLAASAVLLNVIDNQPKRKKRRVAHPHIERKRRSL